MRFRLLGLLCVLAALPSPGAVYINELSATSSSQLIRRDASGQPRLGLGPQWHEAAFIPFLYPGWKSGSAPFAYGVPGYIGTSVAPGEFGELGVYIRSGFTLTAQQASANLTLDIDYDDGFVAYVNGVEIARKSLGARHQYIYHDHPAYVEHESSRVSGAVEQYTVPAALLRAGANVLAIQGHNISSEVEPPATNDFFLDASLRQGGATFIPFGSTWTYFDAFHEPSGGFTIPGDTDFADWIELHNDGASAINLAGWYFTKDPTDTSASQRSYLPSVSIPAGGYLLVPEYMTTPSYGLSAGGVPHLALRTSAGAVAHALDNQIMEQSPFLSFGRASGGATAYFANATPGYANDPSVTYSPAGLTGQPSFTNMTLGAPAVNGYYTAPFSLALASSTADAQIRYTLTWRDPRMPKAFTFDIDGDTEGWSPWHSVSALTVSGGTLQFSVTGGDPFLGATGFSVDAAANRFVVIRANISSAGTAEIFWTTPSGSWHADRRQGFAVTPGVMTEYVINLTAHPEWRETITGIRFDPPDTGGGTVAMDYLRIVPDATTVPPLLANEGRVPTESDTLYTAPFTVDGNTIVRARAFKAGMAPSNTATGHFLFSTGVTGTPVDSNTALMSLPILSLVGEREEAIVSPYGVSAIRGGQPTSPYGWWAPVTNDDYNNPVMHGKAFERPFDLALFYPDDNSGVTNGAGLRIGRSDVQRPNFRWNDGVWTDGWSKFGWRLYFRGDYGGKTLASPPRPLFDPEYSRNEWRVLALRGANAGYPEIFINDEISRRLQAKMDGWGAVGTYVSLFVNGQYKSYMNLCERIDDKFFKIQTGRDNDWDVIKCEVGKQFIMRYDLLSGNLAKWQELVSYANNNNMADYAKYQQISSMIDVPQFIDFILVETYIANQDWPWNNWIAAREKVDGAKFRVYVWDADFTFKIIEDLNLGGVGQKTFDKIEFEDNDLSRIYRSLKNSPEFRLLFQDRVQKRYRNDGLLTKPSLTALADELRAMVEPSIRHVMNRDYDDYIQRVWIPQREAHILANINQRGYTPALLAPTYTVQPDDSVLLANPNPDGTIYYTLDTSDPRTPVTGVPVGISGGNQVIVEVFGPTLIKARVYSGSGDVWSPAVEIEAVAGTPDYSNMRVTEIMYNHTPPGYSDEVEFIEIKNTGSFPINLSSCQFSAGITHTFGFNTIVPAGGFLVLTNTQTLFNQYYPGVTLAGQYEGRLSNGGERLTLSDPDGGTILSFTYDDAAPWPLTPDGDGYSLVPVVIDGNPGNGANWRASTDYGGSPGRDDPVPAHIVQVLVNEVLAHTDLPQVDSIEIRNPSSTTTADLRGWMITDNRNNPFKYTIPDEARFVLPPKAYVVLNENDFGAQFLFSSYGEDAYLYSAAAGALTGYVHGFTFGASENGVSFGRHVTTDTLEWFVPQKSLTLGSANAGPRTGPLVITEVQSRPWPEAAQYVELTNLSSQTVDLYDTVSGTGWRIEAIGFQAAASQPIPPGGKVILSSEDPAVFAATHIMPAGVPVLGPFVAIPPNGAELVLQWPAVDDTTTAWIEVDRVVFSGSTPWPQPATSSQEALRRKNNTIFGSEPTNWSATTATCLYDADGDGLPDYYEVACGLDPNDDGSVYPQNGPQGDLDNDGFTNAEEYARGTDAGDPNDRPGAWADFAWTGAQSGSFSQPFNRLATAIPAIPTRGLLKIKGNTAQSATSERPRITTAMRISAHGGRVRIGDVNGAKSMFFGEADAMDDADSTVSAAGAASGGDETSGTPVVMFGTTADSRDDTVSGSPGTAGAGADPDTAARPLPLAGWSLLLLAGGVALAAVGRARKGRS